jgi:hypothetical protein
MTTSDIRRQSSSVVVEGRGVMMWCGLNLELESGGAGVEVVIAGVSADDGEGVEGIEGRLENSTIATDVSTPPMRSSVKPFYDE